MKFSYCKTLSLSVEDNTLNYKKKRLKYNNLRSTQCIQINEFLEIRKYNEGSNTNKDLSKGGEFENNVMKF